MDFKNTLRSKIDQYLDSIEKSQRENYSELICNKVINSKLWRKSKKIFTYISFKNEVITDNIIINGLKEGKDIYTPVILGSKMIFYKLENLNNIKVNKYGIREPYPEIAGIPDSNSLFIIPGVAFTPNLDRLGRGGGFYDRFLGNYPDTKKMAIAYNCQIVGKVPLEKWDIAMDMIITEENEYGRN